MQHFSQWTFDFLTKAGHIIQNNMWLLWIFPRFRKQNKLNFVQILSHLFLFPPCLSPFAQLQLKFIAVRKIDGRYSIYFKLQLQLLIFTIQILAYSVRLLHLFVVILECFKIRLERCHKLLIVALIGSAEVGPSEIVDAVGNDFEEVAGRKNAGLLVFLLKLPPWRTESLFKHRH